MWLLFAILDHIEELPVLIVKKTIILLTLEATDKIYNYWYSSRLQSPTNLGVTWDLLEKSWLIWKDPDAGRDWGQEEKGTIEDEMVGWHLRLNGRESG